MRDRFFPLPSEVDPGGVAAGADPPEAGLGAEEAVVDAVSPEAWPEADEAFLLHLQAFSFLRDRKEGR